MKRPLRLLFLSTADAAPARTAARWARLGTAEHLVVDAAGIGRQAGTGLGDPASLAALQRADLVVIIEVRPEPRPLALNHPGGRIDWHLPMLENTAKHASLQVLEHSLRARVSRLRVELGLGPIPGRPRAYPLHAPAAIFTTSAIRSAA